MEGAEHWWCDWVPVEHGKGVGGCWAELGSTNDTGDVYNSRAGWVRVVQRMPETVVSSCVEVVTAGTGKLGACEGKAVNGGVVTGEFCRGSMVYAEVLGAEYQGWGRGARLVVTGSTLAAGYLFSSAGGHGDGDGLWYL